MVQLWVLSEREIYRMVIRRGTPLVLLEQSGQWIVLAGSAPNGMIHVVVLMVSDTAVERLFQMVFSGLATGILFLIPLE